MAYYLFWLASYGPMTRMNAPKINLINWLKYRIKHLQHQGFSFMSSKCIEPNQGFDTCYTWIPIYLISRCRTVLIIYWIQHRRTFRLIQFDSSPTYAFYPLHARLLEQFNHKTKPPTILHIYIHQLINYLFVY